MESLSGTVGIIANSFGRVTVFSVCLSSLVSPLNTAIQWSIGSDRIVGRNNLVRETLNYGSEWLFFLDDDHAFDRNILIRLLSHEKDIVASLYTQRVRPFAPIAYSKRDDDGTYAALDLTKYGKEDLVPVRAAGTGGMLIRSEVFRAMEDPWFEHGKASEDLLFCEKAKNAGFQVYCDLGARLGHADPVIIWPAYLDEEEQWGIGFNLADNYNLYVPIESPNSEE